MTIAYEPPKTDIENVPTAEEAAPPSPPHTAEEKPAEEEAKADSAKVEENKGDAKPAQDEEKKNKKTSKDGPNGETMKELSEKRKQVQALNNAIKNLRCQELFAYKNKKVGGPITEDMISSMKEANCDFLRNFNDMWGKTQEMLSELELSRIMSRELSYVPSSVVALHTKVKRSESFEKLNSKKLPRVIVCGNEKSQLVPRIIVCEDKNVNIPGGECITVQETRNSCSRLSDYTSYGGKYCS